MAADFVIPSKGEIIKLQAKHGVISKETAGMLTAAAKVDAQGKEAYERVTSQPLSKTLGGVAEESKQLEKEIKAYIGKFGTKHKVFCTALANSYLVPIGKLQNLYPKMKALAEKMLTNQVNEHDLLAEVELILKQPMNSYRELDKAADLMTRVNRVFLFRADGCKTAAKELNSPRYLGMNGTLVKASSDLEGGVQFIKKLVKDKKAGEMAKKDDKLHKLALRLIAVEKESLAIWM